MTVSFFNKFTRRRMGERFAVAAKTIFFYICIVRRWAIDSRKNMEHLLSDQKVA